MPKARINVTRKYYDFLQGTYKRIKQGDRLFSLTEQAAKYKVNRAVVAMAQEMGILEREGSPRGPVKWGADSEPNMGMAKLLHTRVTRRLSKYYKTNGDESQEQPHVTKDAQKVRGILYRLLDARSSLRSSDLSDPLMQAAIHGMVDETIKELNATYGK